jgi:hypothetical protein
MCSPLLAWQYQRIVYTFGDQAFLVATVVFYLNFLSLNYDQLSEIK